MVLLRGVVALLLSTRAPINGEACRLVRDVLSCLLPACRRWRLDRAGGIM
jgi:hypothetical protein